MRVGKICRDCELGISGILLMLDLRVIDMSGSTFSVIGNLMTVPYTCDCVWLCVNFEDKILLRGEECKTREN